ncbi:MAG: immunoglobulin domain-containing protein [Verrucomicrobiota bacterium]
MAEATLDPLLAGYFYPNVSQTVPFYAPPDGTYYMVMVLAESDGYQRLTVDWHNFSNTETFGYVPPPPPVVITPSITSHPASLNVTAGASATFSVSANGTSPSYQWYKNGSPISGATASSYTIPNAKTSDAGNYTVIVANSSGTVTSNPATLTVNTPPPVAPPPIITSQPKSLLVVTGASARFAVTATGKNLTYQWNKNGSPIKGATGAFFNISNVKSSDAGNYTVAITNSASRVTSTVAKLTVNAPKITSNLSAVNLQLNRLMPRYTVTANFAPTSYSAQGLPAGLKFDAGRGVLSGSPTKKGTYTATFTAARKQGTKVIHSATVKKVFKVN